MLKFPKLFKRFFINKISIKEYLNGYINKDISDTIHNQYFKDGVVCDVRINCRYTLITTNFLKEMCIAKIKRRNAFLVIEYNYRLERRNKNSDSDNVNRKFNRDKINMPIVSFKDVNAKFLHKMHDSSSQFSIENVIKNIITRELRKYNSDGTKSTDKD